MIDLPVLDMSSDVAFSQMTEWVQSDDGLGFAKPSEAVSLPSYPHSDLVDTFIRIIAFLLTLSYYHH